MTQLANLQSLINPYSWQIHCQNARMSQKQGLNFINQLAISVQNTAPCFFTFYYGEQLLLLYKF